MEYQEVAGVDGGSHRSAFKSRSRVVGLATFVLAAGAIATLGRSAVRPGEAPELLDEVRSSAKAVTVRAYADAL